MKKIIIPIFLFLFIGTFSQKTELKRQYKLKSENDKLTSNFIVINKDTLIVTNSSYANEFKVKFGKIDSIFLKDYKNLIFGKKKYRSIIKQIKLWNSPINVFFDKSVNPKLKKELTSFIHELDNKVDSLSFNIVKLKNESNYLIYTINSKYPKNIYPSMDTSKNQAYSMRTNFDNIIYSGALYINTDKIYNEKQQILKLKESFISSLGIFHLIPNKQCNSFLADCYFENKTISDLDIKLINFHYRNIFYKKVNYLTFEQLINEYNKIKNIDYSKTYDIKFKHDVFY